MSQRQPALDPGARSGEPTRAAPGPRANRDRWLVLGTILGGLVLTSLPYLIGWLWRRPGLHYTGLSFDGDDYNLYYAYMTRSADHILLPNPVDIYPETPTFFNLLWFTLGRLAAVLHLPVEVVMQGFRLAAGASFLLGLWWFCGLFLREPAQRRAAYLLAVLTSGFEWLSFLLGRALHAPPDQWLGRLLAHLGLELGDGNTFYILLAMPHFLLISLLLLGIYAGQWRTYESGQARWAWLAGGLTLLLGFIRPYDLAAVFLIVLAYALLMRRRDAAPWRQLAYRVAATLVPSVLPLLYFVRLGTGDPEYQKITAQLYYPIEPTQVLWVFGVTAILVLLTWDGLFPLRDRSRGELLLKTWLLASGLLLFIPGPLANWHFTTGWQAPLAILAIQALYQRVLPALKRPVWPRIALAAVLLAGVPTIGLRLYQEFNSLRQGETLGRYLTDDEAAAFAWLRSEGQAPTVVLSGLTTGSFIVRYTDAHAALGNGDFTPDAASRQARSQRFFQAETEDADRRATLRDLRITYVYEGEEERSFGAFALDTAPYLRRVYGNEKVQIYQVVPERL